jgi:hypothetical protein
MVVHHCEQRCLDSRHRHRLARESGESNWTLAQVAAVVRRVGLAPPPGAVISPVPACVRSGHELRAAPSDAARGIAG